ncbi:MAG TPA: hypothetical protein VEL79_22870 [Vicinamibacterales bacterium]|nr:hypothetical protein [Vicinamibacterales bacterium]
MAQKFVAPFGRCVARRVYHSRSNDGRVRKVTVEIGTPAAVPGSDWGCRVRISGLSTAVDRTVFGVDSVQALSIALVYLGMMVTSSREFLDGRLHLWDSPAKSVFEVALPLPLHSVESALEQLSWILQRMKVDTNIDKEWRAGVLTVLRNVEKELRLRRRWTRMSTTPSSRKRSRGSRDS